MRYGTSGFRDHHKQIVSIANKIGIAMARLVSRSEKSFGIMITASHNHCDDNGVKIMDEHGDMVSNEIEKYLEDYVNKEIEDFAEIGDPCIYKLRDDDVKIQIGYDSRNSSPEICDLIVEGIKYVHHDFPYHITPHVSTPQLHYAFSKEHENTSYLEYVYNASKMVHTKCFLDCANGIGARIMESIANPHITLIHNDWKTPTKLNHLCSSDYVCTHKTSPVIDGMSDSELQGQLCASFDGDADRIVFYSQIGDKLQLLNGDYIAALVFTYLSRQLVKCDQDLTIGYIYTGYTNNACVEYVKSLPFPKNVKVSYVCTATGVKHLHHEALKHDVGVYFEQNGHGNVIFRSIIPEIETLPQFFHPVIGDGVMDLFATLYILQVLKWDVQDWMKIYTEYPSKLSKCIVLGKTVFKSTENELELIQPLFLQHYIMRLCAIQEHGCRAFVRASGTENALRLYVECQDQDECDIVHKKIGDFIEKRINNETYIVTTEKYYMIKNETFWIRPIVRSDMDKSYYKLLGQLTKINPETMNLEQTNEFFRNLGQNHQIHVIENCKTNKIVATGTLFVEQKLIRNYGKVGHIEDIVVDESCRGYGLGKKMIEYLSDIGKDLGCYKCILDCDDKNTGFYERCGYVRKGAEMSKYM